MSRGGGDLESGRRVAAELRALGVKGLLVRAAEQGYITELACKMPRCFCPDQLGGPGYFEPVASDLSDWMPTVERIEKARQEAIRRREREKS